MKNCCLFLLATFVASVSFAAEHTLMPTPQTVHIGHFSPTVKPVLTIDFGDIVTLETAANMAAAIDEGSGVVPATAVPQYLRDIYEQVKDRGPAGHILPGPIAVKGVVPGNAQEVSVHRPQGYKAHLAARGDADALDRDGSPRRPG
jgi:acetamidase/formamidase